jgi:hypothetical protein
MNRIEDHHVKQSKPSLERQRSHIFSHVWETDPKDNHIHRYEHDHTYICIQNMFPIVELFVQRD